MGGSSSKAPDTTPAQYVRNTRSSVSYASYPAFTPSRSSYPSFTPSSTSYSTVNTARQNTANNVVSPSKTYTARSTTPTSSTLRQNNSTTQYARNTDRSGLTRTPSIYSTTNTANNVVSPSKTYTARSTTPTSSTLRQNNSTTQYARNTDRSGLTRTPSIYSTTNTANNVVSPSKTYTARSTTPTSSTLRQNNARQGTVRTARSSSTNAFRVNSGAWGNDLNRSFNSVTSESSEANNKNNKKDFKIPMSEVLMPSGITFTITLPSKPKCFCKKFNETKLINIWPNSKLCPGEHQMLCDQMNNTIKQHVTGNVTRYEIISIKKVKNCCLWTKYRNRRWDITKEAGEDSLNERMLFHGSAAADDIVKTGFDERHADSGGMFGAGVYFAEHSSKSNQYVFGKVGSGCPNHDQSDCEYCERKIILCRVVLGKTLIRHSADKMSHPPPGYHSITGSPHLFGLKYPEFIIYRGEQAYPEYLITYRVID